MEREKNFSQKDLKNIASFLLGGKCATCSSDYILPSIICVDETALYEICVDLNLDMMFVVDAASLQTAVEQLLQIYAEKNEFQTIANYFVEIYIDSKIMDLTKHGYDVYLIKSEFIKKINALWSIPNEEFIYGSNGVVKSVGIRFKEYDKLGVGGFATVYRGPNETVYKVLSQNEKSSQSSVHRFKREFLIMEAHNNSGFTIRVSEYEPENLVYQMERATISLEDYLERNKSLTEADKDAIILRCVDCINYLHSQNIVHRDIHPGNILRNQQGEWVVTDFGLAKTLKEKYSHVTTTTRTVGRAWFTDPIQYEALKDGSFQTDLYSLAKTIDYIFNGAMNQRPHKYTYIIHKAIAPDLDVRYKSVSEMREEIQKIISRVPHLSIVETVSKMVAFYKNTGKYDFTELSSALRENSDGQLIWELVKALKNDFAAPFVELCRIDYDLAAATISQLYSYTEDTYFIPWKDYDSVARWAACILRSRPLADDGVSESAAKIIEYVAGSVGRYDIIPIANALRENTKINAKIRGLLTGNYCN